MHLAAAEFERPIKLNLARSQATRDGRSGFDYLPESPGVTTGPASLKPPTTVFASPSGFRPSKFLRVAIVAGACVFSATLFGQSSTASSSTSSSSDEAVKLSPFEVNTDRDVGYTASNSLAGG